MADFTSFYPIEKLFLQEALHSPHLLLVDDQVSGLCWTNVVEALEEIGSSLGKLGIETVRATSNYIELIAKGSRHNGECVGHASIQMLMNAYPSAWSDKKPPLVRAVISEDSQLLLSPNNLNSQVLDFTKKFMAEFVSFMTSD